MIRTKFEVHEVKSLGGVRSSTRAGNGEIREIEPKMADFLLKLENGCQRLFCASGHLR